MAINFPDSPSVNDTVTQDDHTWIWDGTTWNLTVATAVAPAGSNTQVQYNSSGAFAGSANFTFDGSAAVVNGPVFAAAKMQTGQTSWTQEPWSNQTIAIGDLGSVGTQGSYRLSLAWNYERGTDSNFHHLDVNSYPQAAGIDLGHTGILFQTHDDYENNHTTAPTTRMIVTPDGDVGIGTSTPMRELDVWSEVLIHHGDDAWLWQNAGSDELKLWFQDSYTSGDSGWSQKAQFTNTSAPLYLYGLANNQGAYIRFMDSDGDEMAYVGSPNNDDIHLKSNATNGYMYLGAGNNYQFYSSYAANSGFYPYVDNYNDLGTSGRRWDDVYATNGTIQTSDVNLKKDIIDATLGLDFINALRPVEYKWKEGSRKHQGFIAQEVKTVLDAQDVAADQALWGLNTIKEGAKIIVPVEDENGIPQKTEVDNEERQSLRYTELIAPLVKAVQELTTRIEALEG